MEKQHGGADSFSGEKRPEQPVISDDDKAAVDLFYEKMGKLNESSGLSLVWVFSIFFNSNISPHSHALIPSESRQKYDVDVC